MQQKRLFNFISESSAKYEITIVVGDFNVDISVDLNLLRTLTTNLRIINHFCPTHHWPNARPSLIDVALTKRFERIKLFSHFNLIPSTYHDILMISYESNNFNNGGKTSFTFNDYGKIDVEKLHNEVNEIDWNICFKLPDINGKIEIINENLNYSRLFTNNVRLTTVRIKQNSNGWFNRDLNLMINERKVLYDNYMIHKRNNDGADENKLAKGKYIEQCKLIKNYINYLKKNKFRDDMAKSKTNK